MSKDRVLESGELSDITSEEDYNSYHPSKNETARKKLPRKKNLKSSINNILIDFAPRAHRDDIVDTRRKIMQLFSLYKSRKYEEFEKLSQKYQRNAERSKNRPKKTVSSTVNRSAHQRQSDRVHKEVLRLLDTKEFCSAPPAQSKRCSKQTERFEDSLFGRSTLPAKNDASNGIEVISDDDDYSNDDDSDYDNSSDDDVPLSMRVPEKNGKSSGKTPDSRRQSQNSEKGNYLDDIETYLRIKRSHKIQQLVRKDEWKVASGEGSSSLRMLRKRANNEQSPGSSQSSDESQISYKSKVQNGRKLLDNMEFYSPPKKQRTLAKSPGGARTCVWIASSSDDELDRSKSNSNGKKVAGGSNSERNQEHALQESARSMEISDSSSYDECSLVECMKQTSTTKTKLPPVEETQQPVFIDMTMMISSDEEDPNEMNLGPAIESNSDPDDGSQTIRSPQYIPEEERNENKELEEIRVTSSTDVLAKEIIPDLGDFEEVLAFSNIEMEQLPVTSNMEKIPGLDDFEEVLDRFHTDTWNEVNEADEAPQKNNETEMIADWCDIYTTPEVGAEEQVIADEDEKQTQPIENEKLLGLEQSIEDRLNEMKNETALNSVSTAGLQDAAPITSEIKPKKSPSVTPKNFQHKRKKMYHTPMIIKVEKLDYEDDNGVE